MSLKQDQICLWLWSYTSQSIWSAICLVMSLFSKRGCWMDLVVWNILLTWPWALLWLPICFWVQLLDLILILKGLRTTLFGPWLNIRCPEIPSCWGVFIQFSWTQFIRRFEQYEKSYILVDSGLRNRRTRLQLKLYVLDMISFTLISPHCPLPCPWLQVADYYRIR